MKISDIKVEFHKNQNILSGKCGNFDLWYKFPDSIKPEVRADAFVAASLVPAMIAGTDIELDESVPVSPKLLANLDVLQSMFVHWEKYLAYDLNKVEIRGGLSTPAPKGLDKTISFFSGGVDGIFTLLKNADEIDLAVFSNGIDIQLENSELYDDALQRNSEYLKGLGKEIVSIETNVRYLGHKLGNISWSACFGGGLSSIALAASAKKCFIASGVSYGTLHPEGSNFITDHLWGNEYTQIVHDGAQASRVEKIAYISHDSDALEVLRVCWQDKGYNCGHCEKCLRTMAAIRALKLEVSTFPLLTDELIKSELVKIKIYDRISYDFVIENLQQAELAGDEVLVKALSKIKRNFELREIARQIDQTLFSGRLKRFQTSLK